MQNKVNITSLPNRPQILPIRLDALYTVIYRTTSLSIPSYLLLSILEIMRLNVDLISSHLSVLPIEVRSPWIITNI